MRNSSQRNRWRSRSVRPLQTSAALAEVLALSPSTATGAADGGNGCQSINKSLKTKLRARSLLDKRSSHHRPSLFRFVWFENGELRRLKEGNWYKPRPTVVAPRTAGLKSSVSAWERNFSSKKIAYECSKGGSELLLRWVAPPDTAIKEGM